MSSAVAKEQPSWGIEKTSPWDPEFWVPAPHGKRQAYLAPGTSAAVATKHHSLYHQVSQLTLYFIAYSLNDTLTESQDKLWYLCRLGMGIYYSTFMVQNCLDSNCKWDPFIFIQMLLEILYDWFSSDLGLLDVFRILPITGFLDNLKSVFYVVYKVMNGCGNPQL